MFKSLKSLEEELVNIRLAAVNSSVWEITLPIIHRARVAINDAIRTYPFNVQGVLHSLQTSPVGYVTLPSYVDRVTGIQPASSTITATVAFRHLPTVATNLVEVSVGGVIANGTWINLEYETNIHELPGPVGLRSGYSIGTNEFTNRVPISHPYSLMEWPSQGYLHYVCHNTSQHEIMVYTSIDPTVGFCGILRGQLGTVAVNWSAAVHTSQMIYPIATFPMQAQAVIQAAAEANMYAFWAGHRAKYDEYTAIAGEQALDLTDVLALVRTLEDKADRRYRGMRKAPAVARVQTKRT